MIPVKETDNTIVLILPLLRRNVRIEKGKYGTSVTTANTMPKADIPNQSQQSLPQIRPKWNPRETIPINQSYQGK